MMPEEELRVYRSLPAWRARIAAAHTIAREAHPSFDPAQAEKVTVPTLMLVDEDSPTR